MSNPGLKIDYINRDIIQTLAIIALIFADNTVVIINTSADDMQKCLNGFKNFCLLWKFKVNTCTAKTKVMVFGTNKWGDL